MDLLLLTGPIASVGGPYSGIAGTPVSFNASKSSGTILSYAWDYGDGTTGSGPGTTHVYLKEGSYRVTLHVTDDQ